MYIQGRMRIVIIGGGAELVILVFSVHGSCDNSIIYVAIHRRMHILYHTLRINMLYAIYSGT